MIKILFLIPNLAHGGAERVLVNLVNHMDQNQFDITVQTMFDVGIYRDKLNKGIKYIGGFPWYFRGNTLVYRIFSSKQLYRMYIKDKYDIVVSYLEGPSARIVSGCTDENTKLITWIHTQLLTEDYTSRAFRSMREVIHCYNKFDRIICVSEDVRKAFEKMTGRKQMVDVLYNTVEADVITKMSFEEVEELVFSKDEINIISVAKIIEVKGFDRLVKIQKRLREEGVNSHIYLVGDGEYKNHLEQLVRRNHLEKYWTFIGFQTNPYKYVRNADLYVCSSHREGFSTAVTEALIVGTPVVSTDCSGAKELLGYNNEYGIVTGNNENALYEGIKKMISDKGVFDFYKKQAVIRGNKFSTNETVKAVEEMLKGVAAK